MGACLCPVFQVALQPAVSAGEAAGWTYCQRDVSTRWWRHWRCLQSKAWASATLLSWTFLKAVIAKLLFLLQTRKCHCTQMKAWPFCSATNPVWALFQLEPLSFPGANSSQASCDEKHVFVKVGTKSRTGQTLAFLPQKATLLTPLSCYTGLHSAAALTQALLAVLYSLNFTHISCVSWGAHVEEGRHVLGQAFPLDRGFGRIHNSAKLLHTDVMKWCKKGSKSPLKTGVLNWKWDRQGFLWGSASDLAILMRAIFLSRPYLF